jgi:anti-sigma B factor antagonist
MRRADGELLGIEIERSGNGLSVVALAGELDLSTIPRLEGRLLHELREREGVVVDLSQLSFIDSSGIGLLIKAHRAMNGTGSINIVVAEGSQVERVFDIAGIGRALPLFLDRDEAIAAVG